MLSPSIPSPSYPFPIKGERDSCILVCAFRSSPPASLQPLIKRPRKRTAIVPPQNERDERPFYTYVRSQSVPYQKRGIAITPLFWKEDESSTIVNRSTNECSQNRRVVSFYNVWRAPVVQHLTDNYRDGAPKKEGVRQQRLYRLPCSSSGSSCCLVNGSSWKMADLGTTTCCLLLFIPTGALELATPSFST